MVPIVNMKGLNLVLEEFLERIFHKEIYKKQQCEEGSTKLVKEGKCGGF